MIADKISNKKFNPIVTELFIRGRKLNISSSGSSQIIQQVKFTYSPLRKALANQTKITKGHGKTIKQKINRSNQKSREKQPEALKS